MSELTRQAGRRQPWVPPALVRHDSMLALTRQYVDPATGQMLDPGNPEHFVRLNELNGSAGFFTIDGAPVGEDPRALVRYTALVTHGG